jgi:glutamine amidotransferase-like uncharacterized protein
VFGILALAACNGNTGQFAQNGSNPYSALLDSGLTSSAPNQTEGSARTASKGALVYAGVAAAFGDAESISSILKNNNVSHDLVTSVELDAMTLDEISQYRAIIWPGGYAGQMSSSIQASTREKLRQAVNDRGVSFVGICAGAFIAISPAAKPGAAGPSWGLSLLNDELLPYYHLEDEGTTEAMVDVKLADGTTRSLLWWGGPTLPEIPHGVVGRYGDNNEPAIIQTKAGKGLVILAGPHPEAPADWRNKLGLNDRDGLDFDLTWKIFSAAINLQPLATLN